MENIRLNKITTILLLIFLLAFIANKQEAVEVVFALKQDAEFSELAQSFDLQDATLVFRAKDGLMATYKARINQAELTKLQNDKRIAYAELDFKVAASLIASDPFFTADPSVETKQWYLPKIRLPDAWEQTTGTTNVTVAIIDTGIHAAHIELNDGRVVEGFDVIKNQTILPGANSDDNGHGTAVAGVIGAIPNNGRGMAGINWNVKLMPLKALASDGTGTISAVSSAIIWASDHGAQIINLSLGGPGFGNDQTLNNAIIYAFSKGSLVVAAAGNDLADQGQNLDTKPVYPICSDGGANMIIGVAASDISDLKTNFSNFGINCVDISAPGKRILTTAFLPSDPSNNVLIYGSGTSLATPMVSGVAALLKSKDLNLSNVQIRDILLKSSDNIDALNQTNCLGSSCNGFLGKGRLNAFTALSPKPLLEGTLVREALTGKIYLISGGTKRYISDFVFTQRGFSLDSVIAETDNQLSKLTPGLALPPLDGTLIKALSDPTVYYIHQQLRRPLTFYIFVSRAFSFADVKVLPDADVAALQVGEWYWPPDGVMVLVSGDPTVFVMDQSVSRPVTFFVFTQRRLSFAKVIRVTADEFSHLPKPKDAYWLPPLDGTLIKGQSDLTVFVIENGTRRALTFEAFTARNYKFSNLITLPDAEVIVIQPGSPILN